MHVCTMKKCFTVPVNELVVHVRTYIYSTYLNTHIRTYAIAHTYMYVNSHAHAYICMNTHVIHLHTHVYTGTV